MSETNTSQIDPLQADRLRLEVAQATDRDRQARLLCEIAEREVDEPIAVPGASRRVTHVWYAHLASVEIAQAVGARPRAHVEGGQMLGVSGFANGAPHLHLGMLLDGDVSQDGGTFLGEDEIRVVLGRLSARGRLPRG